MTKTYLGMPPSCDPPLQCKTNGYLILILATCVSSFISFSILTNLIREYNDDVGRIHPQTIHPNLQCESLCTKNQLNREKQNVQICFVSMESGRFY